MTINYANMQEFKKKALIRFAGLVISCLVVGCICVYLFYLTLTLVPYEMDQDVNWKAEANTDVNIGSQSIVHLNEEHKALSFDFKLSNQEKNPFIEVAMIFKNKAGDASFIDLSKFKEISFKAKCSPKNTLGISFLIFEEKVTTKDNYQSYRDLSDFFKCDEKWSDVLINLDHLETPQSWFKMFGVDLSNRNYTLNKVQRITFVSTYESPANTDSNVQLADIKVRGYDWRYFYFLVIFLVITWCGYLVWLCKSYLLVLVADLKDKLKKDRPLVGYQEVSVESHKDREINNILHVMATEYANPNLDLDFLVSATGVNRTKVNDILKAELGYTFTTYLNKLRLAEAARLFADNEKAVVAEISSSVGYKNTTYFNRLFKDEYNCTPKEFKLFSKNQKDINSIQVPDSK